MTKGRKKLPWDEDQTASRDVDKEVAIYRKKKKNIYKTPLYRIKINEVLYSILNLPFPPPPSFSH